MGAAGAASCCAAAAGSAFFSAGTAFLPSALGAGASCLAGRAACAGSSLTAAAAGCGASAWAGKGAIWQGEGCVGCAGHEWAERMPQSLLKASHAQLAGFAATKAHLRGGRGRCPRLRRSGQRLGRLQGQASHPAATCRRHHLLLLLLLCHRRRRCQPGQGELSVNVQEDSGQQARHCQ